MKRGDSKNTNTTRQIIDNVNKNLSPGGAYEEYAEEIDYDSNDLITLSDILWNPKKVIELQNEWLDVCGEKEERLGSALLYE